MYPLYIDPGTGSMLFSVLIGAAATVYFLSRAAFIKAKTALAGGRKKTAPGVRFPYVIYCEGRQYVNVFLPVLDEFELRGEALLYLTSDEDDPALTAPRMFVKAEYIGEGNRAFARLNMLAADVVLMTTPGLDVYQLKRSKLVKHYAHVLHAPGDAVMYRLFGIDYFDSILLTGDYQARDIRALEAIRGLPAKELVTVGCSYLDALRETMRGIPAEAEHPFTVLVSPTWGAQGLLARFGERLLGPLAETGWRVIVRPHPQSQKSEAALLEKLRSRYAGTPNIVWDFARDNTASLLKADVMISDFSGIIYDYMFLRDRPVLYANQGADLRMYDADDLGEGAAARLWQFETLRRAGVELTEEMFPRIREAALAASDNEQLCAARERAVNEAWMHRGEAGRRIADFMLKTGKALASPQSP